jgi:sugar phosphate isomerase/epimerase
MRSPVSANAGKQSPSDKSVSSQREFAVSTSWNAHRYTNAQDIVRELKELGFERIELNFSLSSRIVNEIISLSQAKEITVCSLHNFCPIPDHIQPERASPDYYSLASCVKQQRQQAIRQTKVTIDTAWRLNAKAVVLHIGRIQAPERTTELIRLYNNNLSDSPLYLKLKDTMIKERKRLAARFIDNVLRSLEELNEYAQNKNISLGIENRFYYCEIPSFEEIKIILEEFKGTNIFYWHDTGHAQVRENLGFESHGDYLKNYGSSMLGVHLHDVKGSRDHKAPSSGEVDFGLLKPYLKKETLKVIEAHSPASAYQITAAVVFLKSVFNGTV